MTCLDLRSDTLTRPSEGMRAAMASAVVGDDVFGEDPTVLELEAYAAELIGQPAALFVPSGTMANQIAMLTHCRPGEEVLVGERAHSVIYEAGGGAAIAGVQFSTVGRGGHFTAAELQTSISRTDAGNHTLNSTLVMVENSHNSGGGIVMSPPRFQEVAEVAQRNGLAVHIDGARLFNAAAAQDQSVSQWGAHATSVTFCLSKGLGAPVGSLLCGDTDFIRRAHRARKMLGGGMRQSGILAAAGLYALRHHVPDLITDNRRAHGFAVGLTDFSALRIQPEKVETNIVIFETPHRSAAQVCEDLAPELLVLPMGPNRVRAVFHRDLPENVVDTALSVIRKKSKCLG